MKVFISWSGDLSKKVADLLSTWLEDVLQGTRAWLSKDDIEKGSIWFDEITKQLSDTGVGILCLTRENMDRPWILFEAGALCKGLPNNRVCPFLVNLRHQELKSPLVQFNGTLPNKDDVLKLVRTINTERKEQALTEAQLSKAFSKWWPEFETPFNGILANYKPQKQVPKRPIEEMVEEILELSRSIQRSVQPLPRWAIAGDYSRQQSKTDELPGLLGLFSKGPKAKGLKAFPEIEEAMDRVLKRQTQEEIQRKLGRMSLSETEPEDKMPDLET